jgi:hypothetical protein
MALRKDSQAIENKPISPSLFLGKISGNMWAERAVDENNIVALKDGLVAFSILFFL